MTINTMENKYFKSESLVLKRSEIHLATYNPRVISEEAKKSLKRGIKKYGLVGGLIVNRKTGMTLVSGHQRISVMDELNKYPGNDYEIRVDLIDVDEKEEKELNILLNNPNAMGSWDMDALREMMPDIDYKSAGLTDEDLNLIGCDFLLQTEEESSLADDLNEMMSPVNEKHAAEKAVKAEKTQEEKIAHNKEIKAQVKEAADNKAQDMEAYFMLSFDTYTAKAAFLERFGINPDEKFVKGELFDELVERVD